MFYPPKIEEKIDQLSASMILSSARSASNPGLFTAGFRLQRHSIAQVAQANAHLDSLILGYEKGKPILSRPHTPEEVRWIRNERNLCRCDFLYWCNPPEAPIWMADGTFKAIGDIKEGDEVFGWEKKDVGTAQFSRDHFTKSRVLAVMKHNAPIIKVTLASGKVIRCTPDHKWANGSSGRSGKNKQGRKIYSYPWTVAKEGALLRKAIEPVYREDLTPEQLRAADWLSGIYDGEGSSTKKSGQLIIAQSQDHNPDVFAEIGNALRLLGFQNIIPFVDKGRSTYRGWRLNGGKQDRLRFLNLCRPVRRKNIEASLYGQVDCSTDRVVRAEEDGMGEVVSLQTSTGNYVCWGYLSKNCTRYGFIIDWQSQLVRFNPNIAQLMALDVFAELESMDVAILIQALKARQLGVTTISELIILWKTVFFPRTNALVASSDPDKSREMAQKMELCFENQPHWLVPFITAYHQGEYIEFKGQNSAISIQHGTQMSGMARGTTPTTFHLSEVCDYRNAESLIDAALLRAVHDSPWIFGILESTAAGLDNYWHRTWLFNIANWPLRRSRLCPMFLPWYVGTDIYPTETMIRKWRSVGWAPGTHEFQEITIKHANRARDYVRSGDNPLLIKFLGPNWEMPPEQMYFWEITRDEYAGKKKLNDFYSELCADDTEAFQSPNRSIFDAELLASFRENRGRPVGVYGLRAMQSEVPMALQARQIDVDPSLPPIDIHCKWAPTQPTHDYQLLPLLHRGAAPFDPLGKIILYEFPDKREEYGIGCDTGFGLGSDNSVLEGLRKGTLERNDAQVFEFASPYVNSFSLWPFALALGTLYSTPVNGQIRQAKMVIEGAANGETVYNELKKRGWRNFHNWVRYDRKRIREAQATRQLWYTNVWSRPLLMDMLMDALNNGWLDINSQWFINEMGTLEADLETQRMKISASGGSHDDRIMALGMVLFSLHALETRHADRWVTRERMERRNPNPIYAKYVPGTQGNDYSDITRDSTVSYNYRVIGEDHPDADLLRPGGARIWTPDDEE